MASVSKELLKTSVLNPSAAVTGRRRKKLQLKIARLRHSGSCLGYATMPVARIVSIHQAS